MGAAGMARATTRVHCFGTCCCQDGQKNDWRYVLHWTHGHYDEFVVPVVAVGIAAVIVIDVALSAANAAAVPPTDVPELHGHSAENDVSLLVACTYAEQTQFT